MQSASPVSRHAPTMSRQPAANPRLRQEQREHGSLVAGSSVGAARRNWMALTCLCLGVLPLIPNLANPTAAAFAVCYVIMILAGLHEPAVPHPAPRGIRFLGLFFGIAFLSGITATWGGIELSRWCRGLIPFLFLTSMLCYRNLCTLEDVQNVIDCIQGAACVWLLKILALSGSAVLDVLKGNLGRLTYECADTLVPFGLIGYILALSNPSPRFGRFRGVLLSAFGLIVLLCAYRSHILLCFFATMVALCRSNPAALLRVAFATGVVMIAALCFAMDTAAVLRDNIAVRFEKALNAEDMGSRGGEIQYAWNQFRSSPIWGHGLGHGIPVDVGHDFHNGPDGDSVGYIHNLWMYLLMDLGLTGFLAYVGLFLPGILAALPSLRRRDYAHDLRFCALLTVVVMLTYTSCQAAFRLIQFNVVLGLLLAVLNAPRLNARLRTSWDTCY